MEKKELMDLVKKYGFELEGREWKLNESGLDFVVIQFEDEAGVPWILRIPRRRDVQSEVEKERRILEVVEPNLTIQAPKWELATDELIAYKAVTGIPSATTNKEATGYDYVIDPENLSDNFISSMAEGMASLHSIPFEKIEEGGLAIQTIAQVRNRMQERMEKVKEVLDVSDQLWARWQNWIGDDSYWPEHTGFIHGDLHPGHILIDEEERVTGFIDWTEGKVADVSTDFMGHLVVFGETELERLIAAYGKAGGTVWPKMKEHIIEMTATSPIDIAEFAIKSESDEYMEMARAALREEG